MNELFNEFLSRNRNQKLVIHCVGDAMIDEYYNVKVERISPECPFALMTSNPGEPTKKPGGIANVVHQFRHFNVAPYLISYLDEPLKEVLLDHQIKLFDFPLLETYDGHIPIKRRFYDGKNQVHRWDIESPDYGLESKWLDGLEEMAVNQWMELPAPDVIVFSDYNKGLFNEARYWMERASSLGVTTIVDPKRGPAKRWKGCTVFKPNAKEARDLSGLSYWKDQCDYFARETECDHVVITCGGDGVKGWSRNVSVGWDEEKGCRVRCDEGEYWEYFPDRTVNVESVIGAGDCFVAMLAMAVGQGLYMKYATAMAYRAGEVYVQNNKNRPVVPAELVNDKVVHPSDLAKRDFKLVMTNGVFDVMHAGHLKTLEEAKARGDKLLVALNTDDSVKRLKGEGRPINCLLNRLEVMRHFQMVDYVTFFEEDTPIEVVKQCKPDVLVKGGDYQIDEIVGADLVPEVFRVPLVEGLSTTEILKKAVQLQSQEQTQ